MKTKARVLSLLLAMLMIVSLTPAVAEEPITIKVDVQSFASPQMLPKLDEYVAEFEKENNINVELTVSVSDDAYRVKLLQDIAAGNQADVCFVDGSWLPEFVAIDALVPLNKWMSDEMKDKFMEYGIAGSTFGDDIVSIWFHTGSSALYYRKDLLAEAGYTEPPKTWSELMEVAKALTVDTNGDGIIDRYGFSYPGMKNTTNTFLMYPFFWGNIGAEMTRDGKVSFGTGSDKEAMIKTVNYLEDLIKEGCTPEDTPALGFVEIESNMIGDQCAMAILGGWQHASIRANGGDELADNIGIAPIPYPDENGAPVACSGGWNLAMLTKDEAKQEAAWKFMEFWTTSIDVQKELTLSGQMTTLKEVYEQEEVMADEVIMSFYEVLQNAKTRDAVAYQGIMDLEFQEILQGAASLYDDVEGLIDYAAENTITKAKEAKVYPEE